MAELVFRGRRVVGNNGTPGSPTSSTALGERVHSRALGRHSPPSGYKQTSGYGYDDAADTRPSTALESLSILNPDHANKFADLKSPTLAYPNHDYTYDEDANSGPSKLSRLSPVLSEVSSYGSSHMDWSPPSPLISSPDSSDGSSSSDSDTGDDTPKLPKLNYITTQLSLTESAQSNSHSLLPLPTSSPGNVTQAHQKAMANRINYDKILPGNRYDPTVYTPIFLHDTLMLPGSLTNLIGKDSPLDILDRLTPARLRGHTTLPHHAPPHIPTLVPSHDPSAHVTGILFLGSGREARQAIKSHYRPVAKRARLPVVLEVGVPVPRSERVREGEKWKLEARCVVAQVFVWRGDVGGGTGGREWRLGEMIGGGYGEQDGGIDVVQMGDGGGEGEGEGDGGGGGEWATGDLRLDGPEWSGEAVFAGGRVLDPGSVGW